MDLLEEYKDLYYREIEHAEKLNSKIQTCITFLTIIGGGITLEWAQLKNFQHNWYFYLYMLLCFITSLTKSHPSYHISDLGNSGNIGIMPSLFLGGIIFSFSLL